MKPPTKVKELQMFLGFVNYFVIYIPFYTWITKPLYRLLSKDIAWEWGPIHQEAYDLCKLTLKSTLILGTERNVYSEFHHSKYTIYLTTCFTTKCGDARPGEVHLKIW